MDKEELKLWRRYRKHRRVRDRDEIVSRYIHLAHMAAGCHVKKYGVNNQVMRLYIDDINGWAMSGLLQAIDRFDPSKNSNFAAYARLRIRGEILDQLRMLSGHRNKNKIEVAYFSDMEHMSGGDSTVNDYLPSPTESWSDSEYRDYCVEVATGAELTERQTMILFLRLRGYTQMEIADRVGLSEARISQLLNFEILPRVQTFYERRERVLVMG